MMGWYLGDLSDADLLVRPVPNANHIAWQLGHLISSEKHLLGSQEIGPRGPNCPRASPSNTKRRPRRWIRRRLRDQGGVRGSVQQGPRRNLAAVEKLNDADFDKPTRGTWPGSPELGGVTQLAANHTLMHAGQFLRSSAAAGQTGAVLNGTSMSAITIPAAPPEHNMTGVDSTTAGTSATRDRP